MPQPKLITVKPTGALPVPLPQSMRKRGRTAIPLAGMAVQLTRFIQRRLDAGDLVEVEGTPAKPAAANDAAAAATKGS
jgi:hypothetical protein